MLFLPLSQNLKVIFGEFIKKKYEKNPFKKNPNSIDLEIIKQIKDNFNLCIGDVFSQIFKKMEQDYDFINKNYTLIRADNLDIIINEIETLIKKK